MIVEILYGLAVGIVLGLTGAGGGILAVPALVLGLGWTPQSATPVALLAVGLAATLGAADGLKKGLVRWRAAILMATLGILFSPVGITIAHHLSQRILMTLFALAMFTASARLLWPQRQEKKTTGDISSDAMAEAEKNCTLNASTGRLLWSRRCAATLSCIGSLSGLLTGMLGVGGGFLIVPAFKQWTDIKIHGIVATSLFVIAMVSVSTTMNALLSGAQLGLAGGMFIAAAILGMLGGRLVAPRLHARMLQTSFSLLSIAVGVAMLHQTWSNLL